MSQQIAALARSVGVPLVTRHGRRVRLTAQAVVLLYHARVVEAQLERARTDLAAFDDGDVGNVTVGAFATAISGLVAPALGLLSTDRPRLAVTVTEVEAPECFQRLDAGSADVVVTVDYQSGPRRGDPRYERIDLARDPLLAVLPSRHPLAGRRHLALPSRCDQVVALSVTPVQPARSIYAAMRSGSAHAPHIAAVAEALSLVARTCPPSRDVRGGRIRA